MKQLQPHRPWERRPLYHSPEQVVTSAARRLRNGMSFVCCGLEFGGLCGLREEAL